ncbi:MAG: hypothetical protein QJR12_00405 [Mycobacterium sp.]|uniref:hypothetical protein n=1 Tax=Mycobacterium sp. TaxID=1785 RepID=UPI00262686D7|nr:hypothetical protein [Mycobacterium sp.]MDI3312785.1 hypothetical protein [Mycobacterium sp.]
MSTHPGPRRTPIALVAAGLLLPALCCGLPVLIAAGAIGAVATALTDPRVIGAAVAVAAAIAVRFMWHRRSCGRDPRCCPRAPTAPAARSRSDHPTRHPI